MGLSVHPRASSAGKSPSVVCHPNTAITRKSENSGKEFSFSRTKSRYSGEKKSGQFSSAGKGPAAVCQPNIAIARKFDKSRKKYRYSRKNKLASLEATLVRNYDLPTDGGEV